MTGVLVDEVVGQRDLPQSKAGLLHETSQVSGAAILSALLVSRIYTCRLFQVRSHLQAQAASLDKVADLRGTGGAQAVPAEIQRGDAQL